jgi:hypothetical protein
MTVKPRATPITDPAEIAALTAAGKWREGIPLWRQNGETLLVGEVDVLKTWREARASSGKRS